MEKIMTKIKENKTAAFIIIAIIILIIVLVGIFMSNVSEVTDIDNVITPSAGESVSIEKIDSALASDNQEFTMITFPVFSTGDIFDHEGEETSCYDEIVWPTAYVPLTKAPLNATLNAMFAYDDVTFTPGSEVANTNGVEFSEARIENGVAQIFISGSFGFSDECQKDRFYTQLEQAALQFNTVHSVDILLN